MSSTNIDRIVTFYKVAKNTNRLFLEDVLYVEHNFRFGK